MSPCALALLRAWCFLPDGWLVLDSPLVPVVPVVPDVPDCPDTSDPLDDWLLVPYELLADEELADDLFRAWLTMLSMSSRYRDALVVDPEVPVMPVVPRVLDGFDW